MNTGMPSKEKTKYQNAPKVEDGYRSTRMKVIFTRIHDETQVGLDWKYPISELIKLRLTT